MALFLLLVVLIFAYGYYFMHLPKFGKLSLGKRLKKIEKSSHYYNKQFQNISPTPDLTEGETFFKVLKKFLFEKSKRSKPTDVIPSQKTDLLTLPADENVVVWFGHSSYFLQIEGKKILVDPVFSGAASPIKATTRSFKGADIYKPEDFPSIDYLFISHDHWDHLDYETVMQLRSKIKTIVTGLGTGAHFERWGFSSETIIEKDWDEEIHLDEFVINTVPARHFSGRGFKRNKAIWTSFVLQTPKRKLFLGGDSGYDFHFKTIGDQFGPFDLAFLECGQFNESWKYIHMFPKELIQAAKDLNTKAIMPVHWAKFALANHAWDEPIIELSALAKQENLPLLTPLIGQKVNLDAAIVANPWWENVN